MLDNRDAYPPRETDDNDKKEIIRRSRLLQFFLDPPSDSLIYKTELLRAYNQVLEELPDSSKEKLNHFVEASSSYGVFLELFEGDLDRSILCGLSRVLLLIGYEIKKGEDVDRVFIEIVESVTYLNLAVFNQTNFESLEGKRRILAWMRGTLWLGTRLQEKQVSESGDDEDLGVFKGFIDGELNLDGL